MLIVRLRKRFDQRRRLIIGSEIIEVLVLEVFRGIVLRLSQLKQTRLSHPFLELNPAQHG